MSSDREKQLEKALAQFLKPLKGIPFEVIVDSLFGVSIVKFDRDNENNKKTLNLITHAMKEACKTVQQNPIKRPRRNEVGNDMEPFVINALKSVGLDSAPPKTKSGKGKAAGYPDVRIETDDLPIYFEVKIYAADTHDTTFRSFFLSPSEDPKIIEEAHHLLVGFEIVSEDNLHAPVAFTIADLFGLECDIKPEFNSDNARLYTPGRILVQERTA